MNNFSPIKCNLKRTFFYYRKICFSLKKIKPQIFFKAKVMMNGKKQCNCKNAHLKKLNSEKIVCDMLQITKPMLRFYEEKGLIAPLYKSGSQKYYSMDAIQIFKHLIYLSQVKKLNIPSVLEINRLLLNMTQSTRNILIKEIMNEVGSFDTVYL